MKKPYFPKDKAVIARAPARSNPAVTGYRSAPFWSLNDKLDPAELTRQLDLMKQGGLGGQFMHSREGLITPYLSAEWMKCISKIVRHSKRTGLEAHLYDEDRWPSGFAGGKATKNHADRMKAVRCTKKHGKWQFEKITLPPQKWYNNTSYPDVFKKSPVNKFIRSTYDAYKNRFGREFGKTVPSIFTDELQYMLFPHIELMRGCKEYPVLPWTVNFEDVFNKKYGYNISINFTALLETVPGHEKIRYDYWRLCSELFLDTIVKTLYEWCDKNNIAFTGHFDNEDSLLSQLKATGGVMPLYEYMHMPGIDHLGRRTEKHLLTIKQCSSVAHQLGKKRVISEIFGGGGQDLSFADRKRLGDWDTVLGINFFCPHLWLYSMRGCRKRDWPPTLSYQQPWWKFNKPLEDYFARMNYAMTRGKFQPDMLILHPLESAWMLYNPDLTKNAAVIELNDKLNTICRAILGNHYDFDFGDESLLAKYGRVKQPKKGNSQSHFSVGTMDYPLVLLPPMITIRKTTLSLLEEFINSGGKVIAVERLPNLVEGERNTAKLKVLNQIEILSLKNIIRSIEKTIPREISITDPKGREIPEILCQKRQLEGGKRSYFMANTSPQKTFSADISMNGSKATRLAFHPAGSHLLALDKNGRLEKHALHSAKKHCIGLLPGNWKLKHVDDNSLTIDTCCYSIGNTHNWSQPTLAIALQKQLEKTGKKVNVTLRFDFKTDFQNRPDDLFLVLEQPEIFKIRVNGTEIPYRYAGWWLDKSFRKTDISDHIKLKGKNTVELSCRFIPPKKPKTLIYTKDGVELESIYITGGFEVRGTIKKTTGGYTGKDFVLTNRRNISNPGNLIANGCPFFAGSAAFKQEFEFSNRPKRGNVFIRFDNFQATVAKIRLNNKEAGLIYLPPYELEVTKLLKSGKNLIEIELTNTLRNLLGPHHYKEVSPAMVSPKCFIQTGARPDTSYTFVPLGLGKIELICR